MKVGIIDIAAAGVAVFAILLPARTQPIDPLYVGADAPALQRAIAAYQADVVLRPNDAEALQRLVETLIEAGQSDWALRAAGAAAARVTGPDRWRVLLAASEVHADRLEIQEALEWANRAVAACGETGSTCAVHERVRLETYAQVLQAGVKSGIDPKLDPKGFRDAVMGAIRTVNVRPGRGAKATPR